MHTCFAHWANLVGRREARNVAERPHVCATCEGMNTHAGRSRLHAPRSEYLHMAGRLHTCNAFARQTHVEQVRTP
eukprot:9210785-Alexandrium_andersonii.AAC.1